MKRSSTLLAAALVVVVACTSSGDPPGATPTSSGADLAGGTLRVAVPNHPVSTLSRAPALDPQRDYWNDSFEVFRCCLVRTLLAHRGLPLADGGARLEPDLAEEMPTIADDGLSWTFRLRDGITYAPPLQDTTISTADVVRALEREAAVASGATYAFYYSVIDGFDAMVRGEADSISGLEAPDPRTLVVHLTEPAGDLANLFSLPATAPIPPDPTDPGARLGVAEGPGRYDGRSLIASGPYMIEGSGALDPSVPIREREPLSGYDPGRSLTLVRNPSWDRANDPLRPAYADRIEFTLGVRLADAVRMIEEGDIDLYVFDNPAPQVRLDVVQRYLDHPELGVRVFVESRDMVRYITLNLAIPPLDDVHVRRAINLAIDKERLLELRGGRIVGELAHHIVPDSMEGGLLASYDPFPTNPAAARAEMARSGYDADGDGRCDDPSCDGLLMLSSSDYSPAMEEMAASVTRDLRRIGIELRVADVGFETSFRFYDPSRRVPMALYAAWGKDFLNASNFVVPLFSGEAIGSANASLVGATPEQLRRWGYAVGTVPSIEPKIEECNALVGDIQVRCWAEADQLLTEEVIPWVPYVFENKVQLVSERVIAYAFDQSNISPALDRIAVAEAS